MLGLIMEYLASDNGPQGLTGLEVEYDKLLLRIMITYGLEGMGAVEIHGMGGNYY